MKRLASLGSIFRPFIGWRVYRPFLLILPAILLPASVHGTEILTVTLAFETEALDLDTGAVTDMALVGEADGTDIRVAYNALRFDHSVVVPGEAAGVELAFVANVPFEGVTAESVAGLTFSPYGVDEPFSPFDTVVVRTDTGGVFKLGNASESDIELTFDYAPL